MAVTSAVLLILAIIPATSYGWGMRGTTIGGERGAMLPGALIGFLLAYFSDILIIKENFYIFSALGAIGMHFGGSMTYGETLGLSMDGYPPTDKKKGLIGVFVKGFLWFGVFGGYFSTGFNAVCGLYSVKELILIFILLSAAGIIFYFLFNLPHKPKENIFPKIYFSKTRRESWGALLGMLIIFIGVAAVKKEMFSLLFPLICASFGGVGWVIGQLLQIYSKHIAPKSTSKISKLFDSTKHAESWKIMECILGSFGGLGAAVGFILLYDYVELTSVNLEKNGGLVTAFPTLNAVLFAVWIVLLIAFIFQHFIKNSKVEKVFDFAVQIIYAGLPFILICLGSDKTAQILSATVLLILVLQKIAFETPIKKKIELPLKITLAVLAVSVLCIQLIKHKTLSPVFVLMLYTLVYEVLTWVKFILRNITENSQNVFRAVKTLITDKGLMSVHIYFVLCIILTWVII